MQSDGNKASNNELIFILELEVLAEGLMKKGRKRIKLMDGIKIGSSRVMKLITLDGDGWRQCDIRHLPTGRTPFHNETPAREENRIKRYHQRKNSPRR